VHVSGNRIMGRDGRTLRLLGVNRDGTEYACGQGWGIFDGPSDQASIAAMVSWDINAVRVPLNEDCWLGINGVKPKLGGGSYRAAIVGYVRRLERRGLTVIVDLHVSAAGDELTATQMARLVDADHGVAFWRSLASTLGNDRAVIFDLQNEPHDVDWNCWRDGCHTDDGYRAAGMQRLVDAVRSTGSRQPIMLGGLAYAGDLSQWLSHLPHDPARQLIASFHTYNDFPCDDACRTTIAHIARSHPVVTGELGEHDCAHGYIDSYMAWADRHGVSYLGWTWNSGDGWTCQAGPTLIRDYNGTPTGYGVGLRNHLHALAR